MRPQLTAYIIALLLFASVAKAQRSYSASNNVVNYEEIADLPYGINRMWLHLQPIMADMWMGNLTLGYGLQTNVYATDKLEFAAAYRGPYLPGTDMNRHSAERTAVLEVYDETQNRDVAYNFKNEFANSNYFELTGCYHIIDKEEKGLSKVMLTSKKRRMMEFTNIGRIDVNSKVRKIIGVRGGVMTYSTTANLNSAIQKQGSYLTDENGQRKPFDTDDEIFSSFNSTGIIVGGNYGMIRNISIDADKFGSLANNTIFNSYFDFVIALPSTMQLDDIRLQVPDQPTTITYSTDQIDMNWFGFRSGFDVYYNQDIFWSFGGELGLRPSLVGQGWYALMKIGLPAFSFKFKQARTANNTGALKRR